MKPQILLINLHSANGQRIFLSTFGRRLVAFKLFGHACSHDMIIADVVRHILGRDFFQDGDVKRCLTDPLKRCLIDRITGQEFRVDSCISSMFSLAQCSEHICIGMQKTTIWRRRCIFEMRNIANCGIFSRSHRSKSE